MHDHDRPAEGPAEPDAPKPAAPNVGRTALSAQLDEAAPQIGLKPEIAQAASEAQAAHYDPLADHRLDVVTYQDKGGASHQQKDPAVAYIERMNDGYNPKTPPQAGGEQAADAMFNEHD